MHVKTWGKAGNPIALLIHGLGSASHAWNSIAPSLVSDGYYVVAPDLPGHGKSSRHDAYSLDEMATSVLEQLKLKKVDLIVGHSMGGLISILLKDKLNPRKLALLDPVLWLPRTTLALNIVRHDMSVRIQDLKGSQAAKRPDWKKTLFAEEIANQKIWHPATVSALESRPAVVRQLLLNSTCDDTLIIRVKGSLITPASYLRKYKKNITSACFKDAGHNLHQEKPEQVYALLKDFIGKVPKRSSWFYKIRYSNWSVGSDFRVAI